MSYDRYDWRDTWLGKWTINVLKLIPGGFVLWLCYLNDQAAHLGFGPSFTLLLGLVGGALLCWAFASIGNNM